MNEYARLVKSVDTGDLKSPDESRASSSLAPGTKLLQKEHIMVCSFFIMIFLL